MAVTQRRTVEFRPWNAYADPALPEGSWFVAFGVAHLGAGGLMTAQVRFQETGEQLSSRLYSIEQVTYDTLVQTGSAAIMLRTVNLETFQRLGTFSQSIGFFLADDPAGGKSIRASDLVALPWYVGAPRIQGLASGFDVIDTDGGIGNRSDILISGYYWGPAARNAPGGPQRPTTGLFGP